MARLYTKEKAKYGSGSGTIICWPVELQSTDPSNEANVAVLPAGYLKCDGSIYKAEDYPALAEILGTGVNTKFIRYDINNDVIDSVGDDEFMVPDLGSKFMKPTTGASAGTYINILTETVGGVEKRRSGMGIEASSTAGTTAGNTVTIPVTYTGNFVVPSQEISLKGKPSWTKGTNNSGYTDEEAVDSLALHSHMHFSTTNRLRIKTTNENTQVQSQGVGSRFVASTIPINDWLENTQYNGNAGPGTNQPGCWAIASGTFSGSYIPNVETPFIGNEVVYYNMCFDAAGSVGLNSFRYQCLLSSQIQINLSQVTFGNEPAFNSYLVGCSSTNSGTFGSNSPVPATYVNGGQGVPNDYNGASLYDVVPLNSNIASKTSQAYPQVNNIFTEIDELSQPDGDPTIHSHKITLTQNTHTYKIKTTPYLLSPDNLQTTLTLKLDQTASLDQVTGPYIIMEYLIKY
jgi:hypothetical protein